jgi:hypothetical protein
VIVGSSGGVMIKSDSIAPVEETSQAEIPYTLAFEKFAPSTCDSIILE